MPFPNPGLSTVWLLALAQIFELREGFFFLVRDIRDAVTKDAKIRTWDLCHSEQVL